MRLGAVLFDMDGVVIDTMPLHRQIWREFARMHGLDPTEAEIRALDGLRAVDVVRHLFGPSLPEERVAALALEREDIFHQRLRTDPVRAVTGIEPFLAALGGAGVPRVLATSATRENVDLVLERLNLVGSFEAVVSAEDVRYGKPHPEVYLTAARRAGIAPERCLVAEDALPGVEAAKSAGAYCLGLATSQADDALRAAGADWVAPHFLALPEPVRSLFYL